MVEENKRKFALWIHPDTQKRIKELYEKDNCRSQSEFIEKAVRFYCGYISADSATTFLPAALTSAIAGVVQITENRISRLLFKLSVEMAIMMNVLAARSGVDDATLRKLRGKCVEDVKKSIGAVNFDEVTRFQQGK